MLPHTHTNAWCTYYVPSFPAAPKIVGIKKKEKSKRNKNPLHLLWFLFNGWLVHLVRLVLWFLFLCSFCGMHFMAAKQQLFCGGPQIFYWTCGKWKAENHDDDVYSVQYTVSHRTFHPNHRQRIFESGCVTISGASINNNNNNQTIAVLLCLPAKALDWNNKNTSNLFLD